MTSAAQQQAASAELERMARQLHLLGLYLIEQGRVPPSRDSNYSQVALEYVMAEHGLCKHKQR